MISNCTGRTNGNWQVKIMDRKAKELRRVKKLIKKLYKLRRKHIKSLTVIPV